MTMNRRDALKSVALMMGGTMVGASALLSGCSPEHQIEGLNFGPDDIAFLDELGDTIIPETDTPGAKAAGIGPFMVMMVKDCYDAEQQKTFVDGLNTIRKDFKSEHGKDFVGAPAEERLSYLNGMYEKYKASGDSRDPQVINMLRDLTVLGYFSSEIGATQALNFVETPGRFDPCIPWSDSDKAYAI
ncbi:gluconate 2-dehydrogenase subunit 3 family protein [Algoriphagus halophytocola]|uniref:Gluconate 2-dehydrogenase subunit 3 family protein n=1 Tax=Algoriphagus halophytocola TaxID=2991499 RepID=A0ABY6MFP0_9BACT|nr:MULTISPECIES: gluconate 2-dehydrogenase subunit 3 family protein [unclassified Algoriphagus]UZD22249.1 gluconate 2-dehydrogenase subunit 3 family protein [Algoriphagus sp. TR-M5]WBL43497.1 gluconate 2-dehydrogenase subunit 3 family protein [Algoriphagus sp. TR-M9]